MALSQAKVVALWKEVLTLSRLDLGEAAIVLTKPESNPRHIEGALAAAIDLGAHVFTMQPVIGEAPLRANRCAMEALKGADFVIDLLGLHILRSADKSLTVNEKNEVIRSGTRVLYATEPPETLQRLMPSPDDKRRVLAAGARLAAAKTMRIESEAGTDLRVELGKFPVTREYGYSDEAGHWDHWGAGFVAVESNEGSANGTLVIDRGDIIYPFNTYVQSPITLTIRDGYIRAIEGAFDAHYLRSYIEKYRDPEAFAVSHLGWGLQPKCDWTALGILKHATNGNDGRAYYGNFMFSTGPNTNAGGTRDTLCHLDIPMLNCSVYLDNEPMVVKGEVIPADQRAPGR